MADQRLTASLDLMRRMPPDDIESSLTGLIDLYPDGCEELLSSVDQPLKVQVDPESGKEYLLCDYNRDGDSYRSPWTNKYFPEPEEECAVPSPEHRSLEEHANAVFDVYRQLYFEGGVSSVYVFEPPTGGFAMTILIKKVGSGERGLEKGTWDSIHVVHAEEKEGGRYHYKLTSTIMLSMLFGPVNLCGSLTRQVESSPAHPVTSPHQHMINIGSMVEDLEISLRATLEVVYFRNVKNQIDSIRMVGSVAEARATRERQRNMIGGLMSQ
eukprot:gnl/Trimastix_PCT/462.p1 GENE.gnl/Trimastix_PCT/462~~gnl/Trimastix_PCT/462.p1  ORF type:complete len:269 (+),score=63.69 gnl/Trimastix_PCT/462:38-844(+)